MADKNFIVKNGLEVGGQEVVSSSGVVTSAALGGQTLASTDSPTFNNLTLTNDIAVGGDLNLTGDLNITGDVNSLSVTDLDVTDQTITLGVGQVESASGGSGIVVDGSNASILWDETNDEWDFNKSINLTGTISSGAITSTGAITAKSGGGFYLQPTDAHDTDAWILYQYNDNTLRYNFTGAGADEIIIKYPNATNATTLLVDTEQKRVGIGTDSPQTDLNIVNQSGATLDINTNLAAADSKILLHEGTSASPVNGASIRYDGANNLFKIGVGSSVDTTRLTIARDTGNVGIGTDSPRGNLEIESTGVTNLYLTRNDSTINNTNSLGVINFSGTEDGSTYINGAQIYAKAEVSWSAGDYKTGLAFSTNLGNSLEERMRIDFDGNVGIGTNSPTLKLDLSSSTSFGLPGTSGTTPVGFARIGYTDRTWSGNEILMGIINASANNYAGYIQCKVPTDYSGARPFLINPQGGNVGIGTESTSSKLNVVGGATNPGISIKSGGNSGVDPFRVTWVGGTEGDMFIVDDAGRVGIGTTSPTGSLHLTTVDSGGADVHYVAQNTANNRIAGYKILDESSNTQVSLTYDNGSNRGNLNLGQADGEIIYVYGGSSIKSGFGIDLSGSSRELSIFHTSSGTNGNIALGKRLESNGTFSASVQITPAGTAGTANLIVNNVNSNAFNHVQENKVPNLTAGEDVFLGLGKSTNTKNMGYLGYEWNASGSDSNYIHLSHWGADGLLRVYGNGNYSFAGSNVSDRDLKENIISVTDTALDKITQLEVRKFNFIKDYEVSSDGGEVETPRTQVGFIAQEVEAIIPDITVGTDGQKDMGVDTVGLVGYLTKAIQEQQTIIDDLKSRLDEAGL
jgi:hypothetical protein